MALSADRERLLHDGRIGEELVRQSTNEYLSAALEAITGRVKAAIDPNVVKEINSTG